MKQRLSRSSPFFLSLLAGLIAWWGLASCGDSPTEITLTPLPPDTVIVVDTVMVVDTVTITDTLIVVDTLIVTDTVELALAPVQFFGDTIVYEREFEPTSGFRTS